MIKVEHDAELSDDSDIWELDLPVRAYNALVKIDRKTVGQLCDLTEADVRNLRGVGKSTANKVIEILAARGRQLKKEA